MNKQQYLGRIQERLREIVDNPIFHNQISQVRARAIQSEFGSAAPTQFTFSPDRIWRYCDYLFSESSLLLQEGFGDKQQLLENVKIAAETFEFLARFADDDDYPHLILNSAMCYHIAGYQANAQCVSKILEEHNVSTDSLTEPGTEGIDITLARTFIDSVTLFLRRDIKRLLRQTAFALEMIDSIQQQAAEDLLNGSLALRNVFEVTANAYLQHSLKHFVQFCLSGEHEYFSQARASLQSCYAHFEKAGDASLGTIASETRTALELFLERSTWSNIERHANSLLGLC